MSQAGAAADRSRRSVTNTRLEAAHETSRDHPSNSGNRVTVQLAGSLMVVVSILLPARAALPEWSVQAVAGLLSIVSVPILWRHRDALTWWVVGLVSLGMLSLAWSINPTASSSALVGLILVSLPAMAGGAILRTRWLLAAIAVGCATSSFLISQPQGTVPLFNVNTHAKLLLVAAIATAGLALTSGKRGVRLLAVVPLAAFIPIMIESGSTQAAVGWAVAVGVMVGWRTFRTRAANSLVPAAVLIVGIASALAILTVAPFFWGRSAFEEVAATGRADIWNALLTDCDLASCGLGGGLGTILTQTAGYFVTGFQAHNLYVMALLELGLLGLALVLAIILLLSKRVLQCASPAFPALIFALLVWTVSSDIINVSDSYVLTVFLAVAAHLGVDRECRNRRAEDS